MEEFDKKYYMIRDVADFIGVPQTTIRYWEQEFAELNPQRNPHGRRHYTGADIETLRVIHYLLKVKGLRLEAAKDQLKAQKKRISRKLKVLDELAEVRSELEVLLKTLGKR